MVTINKKLEALTMDQIKPISEEYLRGWQDLLPKYGFTIKGFNNKRAKFGFEERLTRDLSMTYRAEYVKDHFSKDEIKATLLNYMLNARVDDDRWNGIDLFDCHFNGKDYAKCFKKIIGPAEFKKLSERARLVKIRETDQNRYGGVGLAGQQTKQHAQVTNVKRYGGANVMDGKMIREYELFRQGKLSKMLGFLQDPLYAEMLAEIEQAYQKYLKTGIRSNWLRLQSRHEVFVYTALVHKFGYDDVFVQYGIEPKDDRYPFSCDFYVKSEDLFIELNMHYSHGDRWFDPSRESDCLSLRNYKQLGTQTAIRIVKTWGSADIMKRKFATDNNLNYLVFWNGRSQRSNGYDIPKLPDFYQWLVDYQCDTTSFLKDHPENTY